MIAISNSLMFDVLLCGSLRGIPTAAIFPCGLAYRSSLLSNDFNLFLYFFLQPNCNVFEVQA
jgi:hypothetical protein